MCYLAIAMSLKVRRLSSHSWFPSSKRVRSRRWIWTLGASSSPTFHKLLLLMVGALGEHGCLNLVPSLSLTPNDCGHLFSTTLVVSTDHRWWALDCRVSRRTDGQGQALRSAWRGQWGTLEPRNWSTGRKIYVYIVYYWMLETL